MKPQDLKPDSQEFRDRYRIQLQTRRPVYAPAIYTIYAFGPDAKPLMETENGEYAAAFALGYAAAIERCLSLLFSGQVVTVEPTK